jgi:hypothetical protein
MPRRPTRRWILFALVAVLTSASPALAAPFVFHSPLDDGANPGVAEIAAGEGSVALSLWLDPDGSDFYEYLVSFAADPGFTLISFEPAAIEGAPALVDVVFAPGDGGSLALISGSAFEAHAGPLRIGTLVVSGLSAGAELRLATLPGVARPALVDTDFELVDFENPQTIARVVTSPIPEPRSVALFLVGAAIVAFAVARRAAA